MMLVTEWKTRGEDFYAWTTWFGFEGQRMAFTQDFLDQLGVDRSSITDDDALTDALEARIGLLYRCATSAWGSGGGINVELLGRAGQQRLTADVPIDESDVVRETVPPSGDPADDDIPF
jgi:hypothetical protein